MDTSSRDSRQTTGLDSAASSKGPRKVRGTTPGKSWWSYCGETGVTGGGGQQGPPGAEPHLLHGQPVVEQVVSRLQVEALLHLGVGTGEQVYRGHGHQQQQQRLPALRPLPGPSALGSHGLAPRSRWRFASFGNWQDSRIWNEEKGAQRLLCPAGGSSGPSWGPEHSASASPTGQSTRNLGGEQADEEVLWGARNRSHTREERQVFGSHPVVLKGVSMALHLGVILAVCLGGTIWDAGN